MVHPLLFLATLSLSISPKPLFFDFSTLTVKNPLQIRAVVGFLALAHVLPLAFYRG